MCADDGACVGKEVDSCIADGASGWGEKACRKDQSYVKFATNENDGTMTGGQCGWRNAELAQENKCVVDTCTVEEADIS